MVALLRSRGETLKRLGSEWEWKFHEERVTIRNNVWFDQYTQKGGDAVDFFAYFYGESEEQAAAMLLNCSVQDLEKLPARSPPVSSRPKQEEPKQLEIPLANATMRRVFAYLCQTRGIAPEVVSAFARKDLLYVFSSGSAVAAGPVSGAGVASGSGVTIGAAVGVTVGIAVTCGS